MGRYGEIWGDLGRSWESAHLLQYEQALLQARHHQRVDVGAAEARGAGGERRIWRHDEARVKGHAPPAR